MGINKNDQGETQITKSLKHNRKTKESNAMLYHFTLAKLENQSNNTERAIANFTKVINTMKPQGTFEKNMYWQAVFECADLHYKAGNKSDAIPLLKKIVKNSSSASFKNSANSALAFIDAN